MRMSIEDGPGDTLSPSESLDSDDVRNNDGDDVVDPPDGWSEADKFGTTAREEREGESLDEKLSEEEPDTPLEEQSEVSLADLPDDELTEDVDRVLDDEDIDIPVFGTKHANVVEGVIVEDSRTDRGQIDGVAEDGDSFFTVLD
ncbi:MULTISPECIES: hypothetical protein [unclassified Rhodococcus (in: high G+C Gram-positive bacteria)]|uniref:hypothetical protein n=1 Tax=unclassified Rhodococcus (in: high G+C Gram-positive bacteria) TaxID=192944 RepID=UPI001639D7EB|nr:MULTISPECIES: hypothetical protein [unclassified Rhodococcus (in: high G+C Gram-positive bacteria)]MBC2639067.1 hypothetical protein [Rhodococcus sp. 3A]MBC2896191.1 hypothetical protein [Rhodococcus sp. 4CII]